MQHRKKISNFEPQLGKRLIRISNQTAPQRLNFNPIDDFHFVYCEISFHSKYNFHKITYLPNISLR